jgi:hypothetical protein
MCVKVLSPLLYILWIEKKCTNCYTERHYLACSTVKLFTLLYTMFHDNLFDIFIIRRMYGVINNISLINSSPITINLPLLCRIQVIITLTRDDLDFSGKIILL